MTIKEVKESIIDIEHFCNCVCAGCSVDSLFCPAPCVELEKVKRIPFEKVLKSYVRHNGNMSKVIRYISKYKEE